MVHLHESDRDSGCGVGRNEPIKFATALEVIGSVRKYLIRFDMDNTVVATLTKIGK
jgi:hypothetical protein